jgi:hypothetical protein
LVVEGTGVLISIAKPVQRAIVIFWVHPEPVESNIWIFPVDEVKDAAPGMWNGLVGSVEGPRRPTATIFKNWSGFY